jgi:selenocysteine lyase/cysteine desulfurase
MGGHETSDLFKKFQEEIRSDTIVADLVAGLIGHDSEFMGPFGKKRMIYADYVASGRALWQIESFVLAELLPIYANSHTEASHLGSMMTRLRRQARNVIRDQLNATKDHAVIFTGSGATSGINRLVHLFSVPEMIEQGKSPVVLVGPYEHHSNILPWRESGAEVIEIPEAESGGPCLISLRSTLGSIKGRPIIGSFSAASNVTGILSNVIEVTRALKAAGAAVVWDYAGGAPYLKVDLCPAKDAMIDAVVLSPHKFVGGPQATGLLVLRNDAVQTCLPTLPGGGTVCFVSSTAHDYSDNVEVREESGTPNVIGDLRAALCLLVKDAITQDYITRRNRKNTGKALKAWGSNPNIELLGNLTCERLPIFSFRVRDGKGGFVHQQLITRLLSDRYGIQARGGCACAGPYVHRLLGIDIDSSDRLRAEVLAGNEVEKPGSVRLNLSFLATDVEVDTILRAVTELALSANADAAWYQCDPATATFTPA